MISKTASENQVCQACKAFFRIEPDDFAFYEKIKVPPPTLCPHCRMVRRFLFRNEHHLFRRKDDATGKEMFSGIPPQVPVKIYNNDYWNSDAWDPFVYGRDYDFSRPFFEQFRELWYSVPWPAKSVLNMVNSDYCDQAGYFKNSYLCFNGDEVEDSAYTFRSSFIKDSFDLTSAFESELCYGSVFLDGCSRTLFSLDCEGCVDVWFSKNCIGCTNCFGCANLRNKSYHIFNQPYSKEAYAEKLKELNLGSFKTLEAIQQKTYPFWLGFPVKYMRGIRNVRSSGERLKNNKNANHCYMVSGSENVKYVQFVYLKTTDSYDYTVWGNAVSQMYECLTCGEECDSMKFCFECWPGSKNVEYSIMCRSSSDLFGCVGLKKKQYCIFNKQYTRGEYEALREKIIAHMNSMPYFSQGANSSAQGGSASGGKEQIAYRYGEFFPPEFSPFSYNETVTNEFFLLTKEQAITKGYSWREPERREYETTLDAAALPDHIRDVTDTILKEIVKCMRCGRAYRIIQPEFNFYRRIGLPLPRECHECRYEARQRFVNPPQFFARRCTCAGAKSENSIYANTVTHFHGTEHCPNEFETSYPPDRPEIVYCEQCYNAEIA